MGSALPSAAACPAAAVPPTPGASAPRWGSGFPSGGPRPRRRGPADTGRIGPRLRLSLEELGPTFAEFGRFLSARGDLIPPDVAAAPARAPRGPAPRLPREQRGPTVAEFGRFLSARGDLIPPDVAAELARAAAPATPAPFAEARAVLERELDNTLERLFVSFEEAPVRAGPFTQAHRAMLPGERPALVVLDRPGIRRDLLAMRPVADLTRRTIGPRRPVDPRPPPPPVA